MATSENNKCKFPFQMYEKSLRLKMLTRGDMILRAWREALSLLSLRVTCYMLFEFLLRILGSTKLLKAIEINVKEIVYYTTAFM
ncbi:hypothetical protein Leryth_022591 [Lithospermum erythrorhizon]|nr:hypothetical protein Leryth_022591 [Lithospermum erythrorhizon]